MLKIRTLFFTVVSSFFLLTFNSCIDSLLGDNAPDNIVEILKDDESLSVFSKIHERLGYTRTSGTVFAPTDIAFNHYFSSNGLSLETMTDEQLLTLLRYHYLESPQTKQALRRGLNDTKETYYYDYSPVAIFIERDSLEKITLNRSSIIIKANIETEGGVLHTINRVLDPLTSMDLARFDNLDSFVVAMDRVNATTGIYEIIEGAGPYSIVAPRNQDFAEGLADNGWNSIADVPINVLEDAMKEHIFDDNLRFRNESSVYMYSLNGSSALYDGDDWTIADFPVYDARIVQFETQGINGTLMKTNEVFLF